MPFVQAKCPNCGGFLAVDNTHDAAVCQFCGTPFIVEKAITNFNLNVNGNVYFDKATVKVEGAPTVNSLLTRARSFVYSGEYNVALDYYDRILDLDPYNSEAKKWIDCITVPKRENLTVRRGKAFYGRKAGIIIYVDGVDIGILYNGESSSHWISLGSHVISFSEVGHNPIQFSLPSALQYAVFQIVPDGRGWDIKGRVYDIDPSEL